MAKFSGYGGGGNMQALMKQAQKMQAELLKAQQELADTEVVATA
jgi:DNA-binding protein YbaB